MLGLWICKWINFCNTRRATSATYLMLSALLLSSFLVPWASLSPRWGSVTTWGILLGFARALFTLSSTMVMQLGAAGAGADGGGAKPETGGQADLFVLNLIASAVGVM